MAKTTKVRATRRWVSVVGVMAVLVGALVAGQAPAAAELPGAAMVTAETAFDSQPSKQAVARCPAGTRVTGGAGDLRAAGREENGLETRVALTRMQPVHTNNQDRFEVAASEDELGTTKNWSVRAFAFCASPLPGQRIVSATAADNGQAEQTAEVECPAGTLKVGGGGRINRGPGQVRLAAATFISNSRSEDDPNPGPPREGTRATGIEDRTGFVGSWSVTTYAVCATLAPGAVAARGSIEAVPTDPRSTRVTEADCPPGTRVTGGAFSSSSNEVVESVTPKIVGISGQDGTPAGTAIPTGIRALSRANPSAVISSSAGVYCA